MRNKQVITINLDDVRKLFEGEGVVHESITLKLEPTSWAKMFEALEQMNKALSYREIRELHS